MWKTQNIAIESRWAEGNYGRYPAPATDLVRSERVDVIVAVGGAAIRAAQQATGTIPIVMSVVIDPLGSIRRDPCAPRAQTRSSFTIVDVRVGVSEEDENRVL